MQKLVNTNVARIVIAVLVDTWRNIEFNAWEDGDILALVSSDLITCFNCFVYEGARVVVSYRYQIELALDERGNEFER